MYSRFLRQIAMVVVLCLVGCQSTNTSTAHMYDPVPTVVEPGLAYSQPCSPPCWQGLTPGKSTSADVEKAIDQVKVSGWAKSVTLYSRGGFSAQPSTKPYEGAVNVIVDNGIVTQIYGNPIFYYSVGQLIHQLGEPESLRLLYRGRTNKDTCTEYPDKDDLGRYIYNTPFVILYPSRGMVFLAQSPGDDAGLICPDMRIVSFCYYTPRPIHEALRDDWLADQCGPEATRGITTTDLVKWHGFGSGY